MDRKSYFKLISAYIRVILGFIGISSSFLIPLLTSYSFRYFGITSDSETLSPEQLNNVSLNLNFLIWSLFLFLFSLIFLLFLFAKFSFLKKKFNYNRIDIILKGIVGLVFVGVLFLILSFWYFLLFFIPNELFLLNSIFLLVLIIFGVFLIALILSYL